MSGKPEAGSDTMVYKPPEDQVPGYDPIKLDLLPKNRKSMASRYGRAAIPFSFILVVFMVIYVLGCLAFGLFFIRLLVLDFDRLAHPVWFYLAIAFMFFCAYGGCYGARIYCRELRIALKRFR